METRKPGEPNYRPNRHDNPAIESFPGSPAKPEFADPLAGETWDFVVRCVPPQVLAQADGIVLADMCRWYAVYRTLMAQYEKDLDWRQATQLDKAWRNFERLQSLFGLNPVDRSRLKMPMPRKEEDDPMADQLGVVG